MNSLFSGGHSEATAPGAIEWGSIGWDGEEEWHFIGSGADDGHTFIRVQLFRGSTSTTSPSSQRATGHRVLCHLAGGIFRIPPKDAKCLVAIPNGMDNIPGGSVILAVIEQNPTTQFAEDRAVLDFGADTHVIIKGKSVTLQDPDFRFVAVGTPRSGGAPGVQVHLPDGTGSVWQEGAAATFCTGTCLMQMTPSKWTVNQGTGGSGCFISVGAGEVWTYGPVNKVQGAGVYLGKLPTIANTALWGATGIAGVASPSVFISPI